MDDAGLKRRLESFAPAGIDGARERAKVAARLSLEAEPEPESAAARGPMLRPRPLRPRRSVLAIVAFAVLALGGTALAATGVWNPLGLDIGHHQAAPKGQPGGPSGAPSGPESGPAGARSAPLRRRAHHRHSRRPAGTSPNAVGSPVGDEAPPQEAEGAGDVPRAGPPAGGGGGPANGGGGPAGVGGGVEQPTHQPPKEEPGGREPEKEQAPRQRESQTTFTCSAETVKAGTAVVCAVKVVGEGGVSGGKVVFSSDGSGSFSVGSCSLESSSGCQVEYTPEAAGSQLLTAAYSGDSDFSPSQATQPLQVQP